ncbi:glycosyltransferase [candidate division KSB1 bacterium]|nr:glycosyltransferase [candidate division KSB1 bacterium]
MLLSAAIYAVFSFFYILFHCNIHKGLRQNRIHPLTEDVKKVSVIVAARNEEQNIAYCLGSLLKQTYPREYFEVIVVDDHSQDRTKLIVKDCAQKFSNIRMATSPPLLPQTSPKKAAIATGINMAQGEILMFTDADCAVPPNWIELFVECYTEQTGAVASWVLPLESNKLLTRIETLDALAYQLVGAGAIGIGRPFLANGANFSYRRDLFFVVEGFKDIQELGSGDDDLFLQKLYQRNAKKTMFLQDSRAIITTLPNDCWRDFFRQRIRWSSKTMAYSWPLRLLEFYLFSYYILLLASVPLALLRMIPWWIPLISILIKIITDWMLLRRGLKLVRRHCNGFIFFMAELLHLCYVPLIGFLGLMGRFTWKNRRFKKGVLSIH